jgi:hypothetical protein
MSIYNDTSFTLPPPNGDRVVIGESCTSAMQLTPQQQANLFTKDLFQRIINHIRNRSAGTVQNDQDMYAILFIIQAMSGIGDLQNYTVIKDIFYFHAADRINACIKKRTELTDKLTICRVNERKYLEGIAKLSHTHAADSKTAELPVMKFESYDLGEQLASVDLEQSMINEDWKLIRKYFDDRDPANISRRELYSIEMQHINLFYQIRQMQQSIDEITKNKEIYATLEKYDATIKAHLEDAIRVAKNIYFDRYVAKNNVTRELLEEKHKNALAITDIFNRVMFMRREYDDFACLEYRMYLKYMKIPVPESDENIKSLNKQLAVLKEQRAKIQIQANKAWKAIFGDDVIQIESQ